MVDRGRFCSCHNENDASGDNGYGYHVNDFKFCQMWLDKQLEHNIQWKELYPVVQACENFISPNGLTFILYSDLNFWQASTPADPEDYRHVFIYSYSCIIVIAYS